jgi:hypothetical protein
MIIFRISLPNDVYQIAEDFVLTYLYNKIYAYSLFDSFIRSLDQRETLDSIHNSIINRLLRKTSSTFHWLE